MQGGTVEMRLDTSFLILIFHMLHFVTWSWLHYILLGWRCISMIGANRAGVFLALDAFIQCNIGYVYFLMKNFYVLSY
jgi:hypothetical protein